MLSVMELLDRCQLDSRSRHPHICRPPSAMTCNEWTGLWPSSRSMSSRSAGRHLDVEDLPIGHASGKHVGEMSVIQTDIHLGIPHTEWEKVIGM